MKINIQEYFRTLPQYLREESLDLYLKGKKLGGMLESPEGKIVLQGPIDQQISDMMEILTIAIDGADEVAKTRRIVEIGARIKIRSEFINYIRGITDGYIRILADARKKLKTDQQP